MYYIHMMDGGRCHRDSVVWVSGESTPPQVEHQIGNNPIVDSKGNPVMFDAKWTLGPVESENEAMALSSLIAARYNHKICFMGGDWVYSDKFDDIWREISRMNASRMGRSTSEAKSAAARQNGKRGGRPRKSTENPA